MNAIIGFSDLLEKHIDEKDRAVDYIAKIKSSSSFSALPDQLRA